MISPYFAGRHTVRRFDPERPVSPELIESDVAAAAHAPNTGNMQLYSVVATTEPSLLERLRPAHFNQPASQAPLLLTIVADLRRYADWCEQSDAPDPGADTLQMLLASILDATIFAQQLTTILEQEGLGTCWLGTTLYNAQQIAEALALPKLTVPVGTLAVGWPAEEPAPQLRLPVEAILHNQTYRHTPDPRPFYAAEEADAANRAFVADNGLSNLAQLFASVRYPREQSAAFSSALSSFLKSQGFNLA